MTDTAKSAVLATNGSVEPPKAPTDFWDSAEAQASKPVSISSLVNTVITIHSVKRVNGAFGDAWDMFATYETSISGLDPVSEAHIRTAAGMEGRDMILTSIQKWIATYQTPVQVRIVETTSGTGRKYYTLERPEPQPD